MLYPEEDLIAKYSKLLNKELKDKYRVWNISEYSYKTDQFNDQVYEYVHVGYPNPPLLEIFLICKEINTWLQAEDVNVAIVHC